MTEDRRALSGEIRSALRGGPEGLERAQRAHLSELVAYARRHSPYYRELYQDLPEEIDDPAVLPVTDKKRLMARFDDWVTDPEVTIERVQEFTSDPERVGHRFLGRYLAATTTGTSGTRGLFVLDDRNQNVHTALGSRTSGAVGFGDMLRIATHGARTAVVTAPGGHYFTVAATERFRIDHPRLSKILRVFSIKQPLPQLVEELTRYNPASLAGFLGMLTVLAGEQEAGRLRIRPAVVMPGGETMTAEVRARLATAFNAKVRAAYACGECGFLSYGCAEGWYHVNSDWAILEPVDADYRPVPPGELSHTVLLSNLANRVQPFLRYDLGDSVMVRPDPCPCGSPLPAIQVRGRAAEVLHFPTGDGEQVTVSPMAFWGSVLGKAPGIEQFQLVQSGPTALRVRLRPKAGADVDLAWRAVRDELSQVLAQCRAGDVSLELADEPPQQSTGGKFRRVIPLPNA